VLFFELFPFFFSIFALVVFVVLIVRNYDDRE
jgi:hypothetical protein